MSPSPVLTGVVVLGSEEISEALAVVPEKVEQAFRTTFGEISARLAGKVRANFAQFASHPTGRLEAGLFRSVTAKDGAVSMRVGIRRTVFYAPWLEFGTIPKDVQRRTTATRWVPYSGKVRVRHGARQTIHSWHIRPHPYLFSAWDEMAEEAQAELQGALDEVTQDF